MKITQGLAALIATAGLAIAGGTACAQPAAGGATARTQGVISMEQAIAAAERHHPGGKAFKAELDRERGRTVYEVEVEMPNRQEYDVKVDATSGKVISSRLDHDD